MKKIFVVTLALSLGVFISACSDGGGAEKSNSQAQVSSVKSMSGEARLKAEANKNDDGRVLVAGETNLPDGTELRISLSNESFGLTAQDTAIVSNGKFSAVPLGPKSGLAAAIYVVEVMMFSSAQPESVQTIVGNEGQYLTGPLVMDSSWGGKTVEYSFSYTVGSEESIQQAQSEHAQMVSDVRSRIEQLLKNGRAMERYRNTDDLRPCMEMMRENQPKAKSVRSRAFEALPPKYYNLRVASIYVYSCVSCSGTALEDCERVTESLANVK